MPISTAPNPLGHLKNNTADWWWKDPGMRKLAAPMLLGFLGAMQTGYDSSIIVNLQANPLFWIALGTTSPAIIGCVVAANPLGALPGLIPGAFISDRWGRKFLMIVGYVGLLGASVFLCFAFGAWKHFGARFFHGIFSGFTSLAGGPYTTEIAHPRNRAQCTALIQSCQFFGAVVGCWVCYACWYIEGEWSWRLPLLLQMWTPILGLALMPFCPESPRWLASHGRMEEAHRVIAKFHSNGDMNDELVQHELKEIRAALEIERLAKAVKYRSFFATKGNRHRLLIVITCGLGMQMVGNSVITFYLVPILLSVGIVDPADQMIYNAGLQMWNWFASMLGALLCERSGRRPMWLISCEGQLISYTVITICSALFAQGSHAASYVVLAFLFVYFFFYAIAFTPLSLAYAVEILPYTMRSKGLSIFFICSMLSVILNTFINPIAFDAIAWKWYIFWIGCILIVGTIMFFYFIETKHRTLEEMAELFDGPSADKNACVPPPDTAEEDKDKEATQSELDDNIAQLSFHPRQEGA
ncbi:uncharacterized protein EHS24_008824 [Apiotrichum porosum]|uniref:Major facilitator superfamily (MFS) profile domain-containing protein n=1 Tax=Apiotrichum porosum TaxID=105984 RepID=A0A427XMW5_9TREE|nr:uncharacterized protein EHS24_008824 [Apiotrichum porosum]RSH80251.1 hypothetical protein EHS24_008824 [Apiotrichum porosum]